MITSNCDFSALIRDIKEITADLHPAEQGADGVIFVARIIDLGNKISEAVKMVRETRELNGLYRDIIKFYADQKEGA